MLYFKTTLIALILLSSTLLADTSISVIVSNSSRVNEISKKDIKKIFLSKTKKLPSGDRAVVLEPNNNSYISMFYKHISGKSKKQLKKYWATMIFTGRGQPPKKVKDIQKLINYIQNNPNAISYVPTSSIKDRSVKILMELK